MAIRLSGLSSGLDTESIIKELMSAQSLKLTKVQNNKTKLEWKEEKWKDLNKKIYALYTDELSKLKLQSSYLTKQVSSSDEASVKVTAGSTAPAGNHTLEVTSVASSQYVTGSKLDATANAWVDKLSTTSKITDMGISEGTKFELSCNGKSETYTVTKDSSVDDLSKFAKSLGVNLNYDSNNKRFFASSVESGKDNAFTLTSTAADGSGADEALKTMGLGKITADGCDGAGTTFVKANNSVVILNNAEFESSSNNISVNGLNINVIEKTKGPVKINVTSDSKSVYDVVKNFVTSYNAVLKEVNELYYAGTAKGYDVLSDEEKEAMTDDQVEKWENKIKDSLLRRDTNLQTAKAALTSIASASVKIGDKTYGLADFGVGTTDYTEKGLLHIDGDSDDTSTAAKTDKLMEAINSDPDLVMQVFTGLGNQLYSKISEKMATSSLSSALTLYNDKQMASQKKDYDKQIASWESKLKDIEDRYYAKFTAMETAMSKLNNQTSYISSMFGM